jgi:hypothetical protein
MEWNHYVRTEEEIAVKIDECNRQKGALFLEERVVSDRLIDVCTLDYAEHHCDYCTRLKEEGVRMCLRNTLHEGI